MDKNINLAELQNYLKEMMKDFISICNKYNLNYYAEAGTALGTVRHKGFIPWDDDIDLYMPKEDYMKLLSLKDEIYKTTDYEIYDIRDKIHSRPFAKICKKASTIQEVGITSVVIGVYIDIFPLIDCDGDIEKLSALRSKREKYVDILHRSTFTLKYSIESIFRSLIKLNFKESIGSSLNLVYKVFSFYYRKKFIELNNKAYSLEGDYYWDYGCGFNIERTIFPKEWFDKYILMSFEDIELKVPHKVHEYLTLQYGDYNKIPDVANRISHERYFVDLDKRLTFEEIDKIKRFANY